MKRGVVAVAILIAVAAASVLIGRARRQKTSASDDPVPIARFTDYRATRGGRVDITASWGDIGPLDFARHVSEASGLDCVALAPRALDLARFEFQQPIDTISSALAIGRRKFRQLEWERHDGWMLLYFGPKEELDAIKQKHESLPPVLVTATSSVGILRMLANVWDQKIDVEPGIIQRRDTLLKKKSRESPQRDQIAWGGMGSGRYGGYTQEGGARLTFSIVQTTSLRDMFERAAVTLGGECARQDSKWIIRKHVNGRQLKDHVERLMSDLHAQGSTESSEASTGLIAIGRPAIPSLLKALDPEQPALAASAAGVLADLKVAESVPKIIDVWRRIKKRKQGTEEWQQSGILTSFAESLGKLGDSQAVNVLVKSATDADESPAVRSRSRHSLVALGAIDALTPESRGTIDPPSKRFKFTLRQRSKTDRYGSGLPLPPNTYIIDAQCQDARKNHWALFQCAKVGDLQDLWVATSVDGKTWTQFHFTGVRDTVTDYYGGEEDPRWKRQIEVNENRIVLKLPNRDAIYRAPVVSRQGVRVDGLKAGPRIFPPVKPNVREVRIADLKKDTDGDGLTDLIEHRLRTNPRQPDSDKDGIPDDSDGNPLVARSSGAATDRDSILQLLFTYKFAGEPIDEVLVIHTATRLKHEFYGYRGQVLLLHNDSPSHVVSDFTGAKVMHLGGPQSAENTVLTMDGPVCFNESRTRAQVSFWITDSRSMYGYYDEHAYGDQIAMFEKKDDKWTLVKISPWDWMSMSR